LGNWLKIEVLVTIFLISLFTIPVFASSHFLPTPEPEPVPEPEQVCTAEMIFEGINCVIAVDTYRKTHIENFPDYKKSPQYYIDRYNIEPEYKSWFDSQFPNSSIEDVVGYRETHVQGFPDNSKSPEYYVKRLHLEDGYEPWFDKQFPSLQIYNIVGIDQNQYKKIVDSIKMSEAEKQVREEIPNPCINISEPKVATEYQGDIGLNNPAYMEAVREAQYQYQQQIQHCFAKYQIQIDEKIKQLEMESEPTEISISTSNGGGCLIATATFGSELAPQVQQLREIRDNSLLQTESGRSFMESFNQFYYSFSPSIADLERENPIFKEAVKLTITPLLSSLSLLNYVDMGSEVEVLGYGISLILLNVGMYFVLPAIVIHRVRKFV